MPFQEILEKYRAASFSKRDQGTRFERLMRAYLLTDPKYAAMLKNVCLWEDFFAKEELGGIDMGIDLVAETRSGEFWAVQCKCYEEAAYIDKPDADTFLAMSGKQFTGRNGEKTGFSARVWISTTDRWTVNAEKTIHGQDPPVTRINAGDLQNAPVDWEKLETGVHGDAARTPRHTLRPHQETAVSAAAEYFKHERRGKLIMACGTGKTFTALKIAEREADGLTLVLVPSIALVGQILREWTAHAEKTINAICVCSDPKVTQSKKQTAADPDTFSVVDLAVPATTNPNRVRDQFLKSRNGNMTVVFSTYQSIEVIENAQRLGLPEFGLIVCDEAHRTTGVTLPGEDTAVFVRVHDESLVKSKKRLYMTATPRLYTAESKAKAEKDNAVLCSMDDAEIYGGEIYRLGFGEAVKKGLLSDYKVLIFTVSDKDVPAAFQEAVADAQGELPADAGAKIAGCINALSKQLRGAGSEILQQADPAPMRRAVAFCQSIKNSRKISELLNSLTEKYIDALPEERRRPIVRIEAKHIDGTMNAPRREELLNWLKTGEHSSPLQQHTDNPCKILSNVRCLSEGVDVPALDAVMFLSARNSEVDVVQSVGRVMRKAPGKKYGYIIIPVLIPSNIEPDKALDDNERYKVIWSVLNALRAHDDRFNAIVNKIELNKNRPENIIIGGAAPLDDDSDNSSAAAETIAEQLELNLKFQELQNVIFARLVQKVGDRRYWEDWAKSVAQIAERQINAIKNAVSADDETKNAFNNFLKEMQTSIDANITVQGAIEMLAQHAITAPVFDALFENYAFAKENAVSRAMTMMLEELTKKGGMREDADDELKNFYESVRNRAEGIDNAEGRQKVIVELYNNFFKAAFPKMTEMLGIVYTPVEVVDFIVRSANDVLQVEFGRGLSDENVNILDPFTGTGTFITRLIQSGLVGADDLRRKYDGEIFANEIVLLAYYIACVNIENAYHDVAGAMDYTPFEGIALTDTFQAWEDGSGGWGAGRQQRMFDENTGRVKRQNERAITVILGNPPYSAGQKSADDDAPNYSYKNLDDAIAETYVALSDMTNNRQLYDSYIRAFRYSTDRLGDGDGIICFVSNGGWLDGNNTAGFRKSIEKEFAKIYVFNLRGNARTSGELRRKEGGNVFGSGSRTPVTITLLVKRGGYVGKAEIYYRNIGDYLSREDKLGIIKELGTFLRPEMELVRIEPNEHGDWITTRKDAFQTFIPLASEKKFDVGTESVFLINSLGMATGKDIWLYNFSKDVLVANVKKTLDFYHSQLGKAKPEYDKTKISWTRARLQDLSKNKTTKFEEDKISLALYRPFTKMPFYHGERLVEMRYRFDSIFPTADAENIVVAVSGVGVNKDFSCLISDRLTDLEYVGKSQCFPLYYYVESPDDTPSDLFTADTPPPRRYTRKDAISDHILSTAHTLYDDTITKEDIFYYVYGFLHSPTYRAAFADDLKKSLPRIPLVESAADFRSFSDAGRALAELHINYERVPPLPEVAVNGYSLPTPAALPLPGSTDGAASSLSYPGAYFGDLPASAAERLRVEKMRFMPKDRKDAIIFNPHVTIENIPAKAYQYIVNGKPAIEWVMERYQVKADKDSGIVNDPNLYAEERCQPDYVLRLLLSVIAVSVRTVEIVKELPALPDVV